MAVINTGMERAIELSISKTVGGETMDGYPRKYKLGESFGNYISMTEMQLAEMRIVDYKDRLAAFKSYVESIEIGVEVNTTKAYRENLTLCPILIK